jgi:hypothetical protein
MTLHHHDPEKSKSRLFFTLLEKKSRSTHAHIGASPHSAVAHAGLCSQIERTNVIELHSTRGIGSRY